LIDVIRKPEVGQQLATQGWDVAALPTHSRAVLRPRLRCWPRSSRSKTSRPTDWPRKPTT
jgi:hypothetical protein